MPDRFHFMTDEIHFMSEPTLFFSPNNFQALFRLLNEYSFSII